MVLTAAQRDATVKRINKLDRSASMALRDCEALIKENMVGSNDRQTKKIAKRVITAANQIVAVVEGIADIHPVAQAVVQSFKVIIRLELDRQENNEQIAVIYHSMARTVHVLKFLDGIVDQEDELSKMVGEDLKKLDTTIKKFGEFVDVYYRHKHATLRVLLSSDHKHKLKHFNEIFFKHRSDLIELLNLRGQVTIEAVHGQVEMLINATTKVIDRLGEANDKERKASDYISSHGGPEAVIRDEKFMREIAKICGDKVTGPLKSAIQEGLDTLLEKNRVQFGLKIDGARLQISEEIKSSEDTILRKLDSGPHEIIQDEDVKSLWKDMQWRNSVKARVFVDALHDHYEYKFRESRLEHGIPHRDSWTLKILSEVKYHANIGDAIDKDGSGYISTHEVNEFLKACPQNWSIPQWMAFWAVGWLNNNVEYHDEIIDLIDEIMDAADDVRVENKEYISFYRGVLGFVKPIVLDSLEEGVYENWEGVRGWDELDKLQSAYRKLETDRLRENLRPAGFLLMDENMLVSVTKENRIEQSIVGLLFVLLEYHLEVFQRAESEILEEEEIPEMADTLVAVFMTFNSRMQDLLRGWKQQRRNVGLQINCFAGGLYSGLYEQSQKSVNVMTRLQNLLDDEDDDEPPDSEESDKVEKLVDRVSALEVEISSLRGMITSLIDATVGAGAAPAVTVQHIAAVPGSAGQRDGEGDSSRGIPVGRKDYDRPSPQETDAISEASINNNDQAVNGPSSVYELSEYGGRKGGGGHNESDGDDRGQDGKDSLKRWAMQPRGRDAEGSAGSSSGGYSPLLGSRAFETENSDETTGGKDVKPHYGRIAFDGHSEREGQEDIDIRDIQDDGDGYGRPAPAYMDALPEPTATNRNETLETPLYAPFGTGQGGAHREEFRYGNTSTNFQDRLEGLANQSDGRNNKGSVSSNNGVDTVPRGYYAQRDSQYDGNSSDSDGDFAAGRDDDNSID